MWSMQCTCCWRCSFSSSLNWGWGSGLHVEGVSSIPQSEWGTVGTVSSTQRGCCHRGGPQNTRAKWVWAVKLRSLHAGQAITINPSPQGLLNCYQNIPAEHTPSTKPTHMFLECDSRKWADVMETSGLTHPECSIWMEFASHFAFNLTVFQDTCPLRSWNTEFLCMWHLSQRNWKLLQIKTCLFFKSLTVVDRWGRSWREHWGVGKRCDSLGHSQGSLRKTRCPVVRGCAGHWGCGRGRMWKCSPRSSFPAYLERLIQDKTTGE